jgi:hypothetical protein
VTVDTDEDYGFGFYHGLTRTWDEIAYNTPYYSIVKSAGNDRCDFGPLQGMGTTTGIQTLKTVSGRLRNGILTVATQATIVCLTRERRRISSPSAPWRMSREAIRIRTML